MNEFEVTTGNPPRKERYLVCYRTRTTASGSQGLAPWSGMMQMEVFARSQGEAEEFAAAILNDDRQEACVDACDCVTGT